MNNFVHGVSNLFYSPWVAPGGDTDYSSLKPATGAEGHTRPGRYCALTGRREVSALKAGQDFRHPQYRREVFLRFYEFHLRYRAHPGCVYFMLPELWKDLTQEQRLWLCFINGNTQNPVTSWRIFNQFPDRKALATNERKMFKLEEWFNKEYKRLEFDIDRRYHKKDFLRSVQCYNALVQPFTAYDAHNPQAAYFGHVKLNEARAHSRPRSAAFEGLWRTVRRDFYTFGRLSTFSYLEYLNIAGLPLASDTADMMMLSDLEGSKSHRNGLAKVLGRDDLDWHDSNPTGFAGSYTPEVMDWLKQEATQLLKDAIAKFEEPASGVDGAPATRNYQPFVRRGDVNYFTLESAFCTYKSWHRQNRRYPGVYLDMMHDRIRKAEELWDGIRSVSAGSWDTAIFWRARRKHLPEYLRLEDNPKDAGLTAVKQNHYRETGEVIMMHRDWPCFANSYNKERDV